MVRALRTRVSPAEGITPRRSLIPDPQRVFVVAPANQAPGRPRPARTGRDLPEDPVLPGAAGHAAAGPDVVGGQGWPVGTGGAVLAHGFAGAPEHVNQALPVVAGLESSVVVRALGAGAWAALPGEVADAHGVCCVEAVITWGGPGRGCSLFCVLGTSQKRC